MTSVAARVTSKMKMIARRMRFLIDNSFERKALMGHRHSLS
jgi:hypothetical protein